MGAGWTVDVTYIRWAGEDDGWVSVMGSDETIAENVRRLMQKIVLQMMKFFCISI
jgi:hypothetical protein